MKLTNSWLKIGIVSLGLSLAPSMFAATDTGTTTLGVTVAPEAALSAVSNPTLSKAGTKFESYTGSTTFTYKVRTTETAGAGSVTAQVTTAFAVGSGITTADLSHVASTAGTGTANSSTTTANAVTATNILTFAADTHSSDEGDAGTIAWTLVDRPAYKTGSFSTVVTLTISAT